MKKAKRKTKPRSAAKSRSSLGRFSKKMPALTRAQRVTERASDFGFDWATVEPVWNKIQEELEELKTAVLSGDKRRTRAEMGDLLFSLVNLARFLDLEAEAALAQSIDRFLERFSHVEKRIRASGRSLSQASLEEMDELWEEAKKMEPNI